MEDRERSIITQVAFKGAIDLAVKEDLDLADTDGQARFEQQFSYLTESLFGAIETAHNQGNAEIIQANFPGTVAVPHPSQQQPFPPQQPPAGGWGGSPQAMAQGGFNGAVQMGLTVKGSQFGPLPDWLYEMAAAKGVTEVYDNRDRVAGSKRPWFKATTGGDNAPAFWPPR
jgi:hypothetical protein